MKTNDSMTVQIGPPFPHYFHIFVLVVFVFLIESGVSFQFASRVISSSPASATNDASKALGPPDIANFSTARSPNGWLPSSPSSSSFLELGFAERVCVLKVFLFAARNVDCVHRLSVGGVDVFDRRTSTFNFCAPRSKLVVLGYALPTPRLADSVRFEFDFVRQSVEIDAAAIVGWANDPACGGSGAFAPFPPLSFGASPTPVATDGSSTALWSTLPLAIYHSAMVNSIDDDFEFVSDSCGTPAQPCTRVVDGVTNTLVYFSPLRQGQKLFGIDWCQSAVGGGAFGGALLIRVKLGEATTLTPPQFVAICPHVSRDEYLADPYKFDTVALVSVVVEPLWPPSASSVRSTAQKIVCTAVPYVPGTCGPGTSDYLAITTLCSCDCPPDRGGARCERCNDARFCSGAGTCTFDNATKPVCKCADGFFGEKCETRCASCSGHGACNNDGLCECTGNYAPPDCRCMTGDAACIESQLAPCRTADDAICSGHGRCEAAACACDAGFRGGKCERLARAAPSASATVLLTASDAPLANALPVVPTCSVKSALVTGARAIRETSDGNLIVLSKDAAYILDPVDMSLRQAIEFGFADRVAVATMAASMFPNYPFDPYAGFMTRLDGFNNVDKDLIGFNNYVLFELACNEQSKLLTLYATRFRLESSYTLLTTDYTLLRSYSIANRTAVERLAVTVANVTRAVSTESNWKVLGVQVFTSGVLADTALIALSDNAGKMVVSHVNLQSGVAVRTVQLVHAQVGEFQFSHGVTALEFANGTFAFAVDFQSFERRLTVVIDGSLNSSVAHLYQGVHAAYVQVADRWKLAAVSANGTLALYDVATWALERQVHLSTRRILSADNRRDIVAFALRGSELLFVTTNSSAPMMLSTNLYGFNLDNGTAMSPVLLSDTQGSYLSVKLRGGANGAPLQVVQRRVVVEPDGNSVRISDDLVLMELDETRQSVRSTEVVEDVRRVLGEFVGANGVVFTPNNTDDIVLLTDCTLQNAGGVDSEVVISFVMLGLTVLGTLIECSAMFGKAPWHGSKTLVSCVTVVIIVAEIVMLVLSSIALNSALDAIDVQQRTALSLDQMHQRFTQRLRAPQCQILGAAEFCASCGVNDPLRGTFVDAKRLPTWIGAGNLSYQFFPGGFDNRLADCGGNGTALCAQARPVACDQLLRSTCDCERSFFLAPCSCAGGGDTCGAISAVSNTTASYRPEVTAALDRCKAQYEHIEALLSALFYLDLTFTFVELIFDIALRLCWCCAGGTQRVSEWLARGLSILFFAVFGIMLLVTDAAAPVNLLCNRENALLDALPGCEFTPAWSESNAEREIVRLVAVAIAIAIPNTIVFIVDAIRFWLGICSDAFDIESSDELPLRKLAGR